MAKLRLRDVLAGLGTVGGGLAAGREVLRKKLESERDDAIARARIEAEAELDRAIGAVILERLRGFLISTAIKAAIVAAAVTLRLTGDLTARGLAWLVIGLVVVFLARDIFRAWPDFRLGLQHLRANRWSIRRAVSEVVAAQAFERAYERAEIGVSGAKNVILFAASGINRGELARDVANAVADLVREVAYSRIRNRVLVALGQALAVSAVYGGFIYLALRI